MKTPAPAPAASPRSDAGRRGFARFGLAALAFFASKGLLWLALPLLAGRACLSEERPTGPETPRPPAAAESEIR